MLQQCQCLLRNRVNLGYSVNLIPKEFHSYQILSTLRRIDINNISMHSETASLQVHIISVILHLNQSPYNLFSVLLHSRTQRKHHSLIFVRAAQTIDTGYAGYYYYISSFCQGCCCRQTQLINLFIYRRILRYISICRRHIRLRLIIIIIRHKIFLKLTVKLRCQSLIMCDNQCGFIQRRNDICHCKCLTRTGNSKQGLKLITLLKSLYQFCNRLRLVSCRLIFWM